MKLYFSLNVEGKHLNFFAFSAIVMLATTLSIANTGFQFGVSNNLFHIPYVLRLSEAPNFYGDFFYQSLEKFTSFALPLMRIFSTEQNVEKLFFVGHVLSRAAAFAALCWFFRNNGSRFINSILVSLITIAVCPWLMGTSAVGGHGLFINYFTHSELSWGPFVAGLVATQLGRHALAAVFAAIVFSVNVFIGIWLAVILMFVIALDKNQRVNKKLLTYSICLFFILCIPTVLWIFISLKGSSSVASFSYIEYIRVYYGNHFLIETAKSFQLVNFGIILYCGIVAAGLTTQKKFWLTVIIACTTIFLIGSILPYFINNRFVFNLHLLRVDGVLQFLAIILCIAVSVNILFEYTRPAHMRVLAGLAVTSLITQKAEPFYLLVCAACLSLLAVEQFYYSKGQVQIQTIESSRKAGYLALLLVGAIIALDLFFGEKNVTSVVRWAIVIGTVLLLFLEKIDRQAKGLVIVGLWTLLAALLTVTATRWRLADARERAIAHSPFLDMTSWVRDSDLKGPFLIPLAAPFDEFQLSARKTVWVDWKQGAAIMWEPAFYFQWMPRFREVKALRNSDEFATYAILNHIPYAVLSAADGSCPHRTEVVYRNSNFVVCRVKFD